MTSVAITDSGPLIAAANRDDRHHVACLEVLRRPDLRLVIPALCVAESAYFIQHRSGVDAESAFVRWLQRYDTPAPGPDEWGRIAELIDQYRSFPLGATDASVVALAERLNADLIITLDQRHFRAVRPRHCDSFRILPG